MHRHRWLAPCALAAAMSSLAAAQSPAPSAPPKTGSSPHGAHDAPTVFTLKHIDEQHRTLTLEVPLARKAKIEQNGRSIGLNQLQEGDQVRAAFDPRTGAILRVDVLPQTGQQKSTNSPDRQEPNP